MFIDSGWFVQFHTSYVKMINTREELLVKSLNIYLKTVYHADSYNACSIWSYPLQKSYIYSVISVYFDFWSTLVSKLCPNVVNTVPGHSQRYQKIFHTVGTGTKMNPVLRCTSTCWNTTTSKLQSGTFQVWKVALVYELYIALLGSIPLVKSPQSRSVFVHSHK